MPARKRTGEALLRIVPGYVVLDGDRQGELENRPLQSDDSIPRAFVFDGAEIYQNVGVHYHRSA